MELGALKERCKGDPSGFYLFVGEEEYLKRYYIEQLKQRIVPDAFLEPFNYTVFDGPEIDFGQLTDALRSAPMMADYKLVVWKWAEPERLRESARTALEELAKNRKEYPYTVFVVTASVEGFDVGNLPKRPSKLYTRFSKLYDIVNFPLSTDTQLLSWLKKHFDAEGIGVDAPTLRALLFRSGHGMDALYYEVKKLAYYAKAHGLSSIDESVVNTVASATVECDTFALSNAVLERDHTLAFRALSLLKLERTDPLILLGMLSRSFSELLSVAKLQEEGMRQGEIEQVLKLNSYKAKLTMAATRRYGIDRLRVASELLCELDARAKSYGSTGYGAIERFLASVL